VSTVVSRKPERMISHSWRWGKVGFHVGLLTVFLMACGGAWGAGPAIIYRTGFETNEGYNANLDLEGQQGWIALDYSTQTDSGLLNGFFPGFEQQAYIGFSQDVTDRDYHIVWRPINLAPVRSTSPRVEFSVLMLLFDSSNEQYDAFDWTVYNTNGISSSRWSSICST